MLLNYRRVLVPLEEPQQAEATLNWLLTHKRCRELQLFLLRLVELNTSGESFPGRFLNEFTSALMQARGELELLAARLERRGLTVHRTVKWGMPGPRIVETAEECGIDLIVIGSPREGVLKRMNHRWLAQAVLRRSSARVLLVPPSC